MKDALVLLDRRQDHHQHQPSHRAGHRPHRAGGGGDTGVEPDQGARAGWSSAWTSWRRRGREQTLRGHFVGAAGEPVPASLTVSDIRDSSGGLIGFVIIGIDISERLKMEQQTAARQLAEEALRTTEQKYRLLTENLSDAIWTMDLSTRLTYVSPSIEPLLGYTPEEMLHKDIAEYLSPESLEKSLTLMRSEVHKGVAEVFTGLGVTPEEIRDAKWQQG